MYIKPLHLMVPGEECSTECIYCATRHYELCRSSCLSSNGGMYLLCKQDYSKRMAFARDLGCNSLFIGGDCDPHSHREFIEKVGILNYQLRHPFDLIEVSTSGKNLSRDYIYFLRSAVGVTNVSLMISAFHEGINSDLGGNDVKIFQLVNDLIDYKAMIELDIYLTSYFDIYQKAPGQLFQDAMNKFKAKRVSFNLIEAGEAHKKDVWVSDNAARPETVTALCDYIKANGVMFEERDNGDRLFAVDGVVVIIKGPRHKAHLGKDIVLRANGHLYGGWDKKYLIF